MANFQEEVRRFMSSIGFEQGRYNPCTYFHPKRKLRTLVHGDDFVSVAGRRELRCMRPAVMESEDPLAMPVSTLMLDTGLRVSELCALDIDDIDTEDLSALGSGGKGEKARTFLFT